MIPEELTTLKQWVCYKSDKIPRNPYTGGNAMSNNPSTWGDYQTANGYKFSYVKDENHE